MVVGPPVAAGGPLRLLDCVVVIGTVFSLVVDPGRSRSGALEDEVALAVAAAVPWA
jgi:hypothetical protein